MSKNMQNLVLLMEPSEEAYGIDVKSGSMCLNRFSIGEDAAFELSGVHYLELYKFRDEKGKGTLALNKQYRRVR